MWAPSLIKRGNLWYMFYTGVDVQGGNQSIGYATKASLRPNTGTWTRKTTASVTRSIADWIEPSGSAEMRDPFVVDDPARIGKWLMFFVGRNKPGLPAGNSVGVLKEKDVADLVWENAGRYRATDALHGFDAGDESPHVFRDPNLPYHWRIMWTASGAAPQNSIHFIHNPRGIALTDTDSLQWGSDEGKPRLYQYTSQSVGFGWAGTEFLHTGEYYQPNTGQPATDHLVPPRGYTDLLAGYITTGTVSGIEITKVKWSGYGAGFNDHQDFTLHAVRGALAGVDPSQSNLPMLRAVRSIMRRPGVAGVVRMPASSFAQVEVIDVAGRRLRELWHGVMPAGDHELSWDLRDAGGAVVHPGLTFLRLQALGASDVRRIIVLK